MNAPVTAAAQGVRPAVPRASDSGRTHSAAPFASALEGALSVPRASDRGAQRRDPSENRAPASEHRAAADDQRAADRAAAAHRAAEKADRLEARADSAASRAEDRPAPGGQDRSPTSSSDGSCATEEEPALRGTEGTAERAGPPAEPPRGGLPALWALVMGGSPLATSSAQGTGAGVAAPVLAPGVPAVDGTGGDLPVATPSAGTVPPAADGASAPTVRGTAVPAVGTVAPSVGAGPAAAVPTGEGVPAAVSAAVLAGTGAVAARPGTPVGAATPPAATAAAVPPLTLDVVLGAAGAPAAGPPSVVPAPVAMDGTVETAPLPAATGSADAVVAAGGDAALSADAGAGRSGGDGAPPATPVPGQTTIGATAPAAAPVAAAAADVGATGTDAALPVGSQVARHVAVLRGGPDGAHSMTLVLTPEALGPVEVQVTVTKGAVELALRGAHEQGRAALLDGLPDLRRDLEAAGLTCSRVEVDRETGGSWLDRQPTQQQAFGERGAQHDRGDDRSRPWGRPADSGGSGPSTTPSGSTSAGVDVKV